MLDSAAGNRPTPAITQAVLGSTATLVCFGPDDAEHLAPLFNRAHQTFNPHVAYNLKLGEAHYPKTYTDPAAARQQSRRRYGGPRSAIEEEVNRIFIAGMTKRK